MVVVVVVADVVVVMVIVVVAIVIVLVVVVVGLVVMLVPPSAWSVLMVEKRTATCLTDENLNIFPFPFSSNTCSCPPLVFIFTCCSCVVQLDSNILTENTYSDIYSYYGADEEVPEVEPFTGINTDNTYRFVRWLAPLLPLFFLVCVLLCILLFVFVA